jgi:hypothetical protein
MAKFSARVRDRIKDMSDDELGNTAATLVFIMLGRRALEVLLIRHGAAALARAAREGG